MFRPASLFALAAAGFLTGCQDHKTYKQKSGSMAPTILQNENVFVDETAYKAGPPQRWDIVLFTPPEKALAGEEGAGQQWAFRVIGVPGDVITVESSALFVNSRRASYQYGNAKGTYPPADNSAAGPSYPLTVPEGMYFVCGDSPRANDSRRWGLLPGEAIRGKVIGK